MYIDRFRNLVRQYGYRNAIGMLRDEIRSVQPAQWEARAAFYLTTIADAECEASDVFHDILVEEPLVRAVKDCEDDLLLPESEPFFMRLSLCASCAIPAEIAEYAFSEFYFVKADGDEKRGTYALILISKGGGAEFNFTVDYGKGEVSLEKDEVSGNKETALFILRLLFAMFTREGSEKFGVTRREKSPRASKGERNRGTALRRSVTIFSC